MPSYISLGILSLCVWSLKSSALCSFSGLALWVNFSICLNNSFCSLFIIIIITVYTSKGRTRLHPTPPHSRMSSAPHSSSSPLIAATRPSSVSFAARTYGRTAQCCLYSWCTNSLVKASINTYLWGCDTAAWSRSDLRSLLHRNPRDIDDLAPGERASRLGSIKWHRLRWMEDRDPDCSVTPHVHFICGLLQQQTNSRRMRSWASLLHPAECTSPQSTPKSWRNQPLL